MWTILLLILVPNVAFGAIAYDNATKRTWTAGGTVTFSHTTTGSDLVLIVTIFHFDSTVSGVTYNGTALTELVDQVNNSASANYTAVYYLVNPDTGSNNVSITMSNSNNIEAVAATYTGVDTASFPDAWVSSAGNNSSSFSLGVTTTVDDCWLVVGERETDVGITKDSGTTRVTYATVGTFGWDSDGSVGTAGSKTYSTTSGDATDRIDGVVLISLPPATATPPAAPSINRQSEFWF